MNSHGLVQTINNIRVDDLQSGIPRHFICRTILDCSTMEEALAHLQRSDRAGGFHYSLGQPPGNNLLSVEATASACEIKKISYPASHANHLLGEKFSGLSQTITDSSVFRQSMSEKLISESTSPDSNPSSFMSHLKVFRFSAVPKTVPMMMHSHSQQDFSKFPPEELSGRFISTKTHCQHSQIKRDSLR